MHVKKSRLLLLVAVASLAAAFSVTAVLAPQQADATRKDTLRAEARHGAAVRAQRTKARRLLAVRLRTTVDGIHAARDETWRWQDLMYASRSRYAGSAERSPSLRYRRSVLSTWKQRAFAAKRAAHHPPRLGAWLCIHRYEGSWSDPNAPYYGGLQMDLTFQQAYGPNLLRRKGTADHWTPLEQIWVAEHAFRSGRGFYPWPNTARWCGLI